MNPMRHLAIWGGALALVACASTGNSGGTTTTTDTGSGLGGFDAGSGGGGTDTTASAGQTLTIAEIQKQSVSADCTKISDSIKGVSVFGSVVASAVSINKGVATVFVQTKGGGASSGILLEAKSPGPVDSLKFGDVVDLVPGNVKEFYCMTEIEPKSAESLMVSGTDLPVAVTIDVAKIGSKASDDDNRTYEAVFVSLEGVTVAGVDKPDTPYNIWVGKSDSDQQLLVGNSYYAKPPVYVIGADKKTPNYKKGAKLNIQGFLQYSYKTWSLLPTSIAPAN